MDINRKNNKNTLISIDLVGLLVVDAFNLICCIRFDICF